MRIITRYAGFTAIELLAVIAVLGILASIGILGWSNIQIWSRNNARVSEVQQWASTFDLYRSRFGGYPVMPTADGTTYYCLGSFTSFGNKCGQYTLSVGTKTIDATLSSSMVTEVKKVGNVPGNTVPAIGNQIVGPYLSLTQQTVSGTPNTVTVTAKFVGIFQGTSCPNNSSLTVVSPASAYVSGVGNVIECSTSKSLSYTN